MSPRLRIAFADFWPGFNRTDNRIWNALATRYVLELVTELQCADLLIFGDFGNAHWDFRGRKVYLTGENMLPDFDQCDLAFTPAEIPADTRAVRLPYYAQIIADPASLLRPPGYAATRHLSRADFCTFVASNPMCRPRNKLFKALHRKRPVHSGGKLFNNTGGPITDKMAFLREARFNIACENSSSPGYITEKLLDALNAQTIPIYWGAPDVDRDFDPRCMINVRDYAGLDELAEAVLRIDQDEAARLCFLQAPIFPHNTIPECMATAFVLAPLTDLLESRTPARRTARPRRLHEHIRNTQSFFGYKYGQKLCKIEDALWKYGLWR